jgi:5S rRNA maturation endonuclease (ribonuclease M5)/predicted HicB family RNase H-like nuclease
MHIKFLSHGSGSAKAAADYLTQEIDHKGEVRPGVEVLRGDLYSTAAVADSLEFKNRYTSGVIAFHPDDNPTPEQIEEVLNEFEKTAFAGLDPERYSFSAVRHDEKNSCHIHIIVARVELETSKSMNIAPPGHHKSFDLVRDYFNEKYGWATPDVSLSQDHERLVQPGHLAYLSNDKKPKQVITDFITSRIEAGEIKNRSDVIAFLADEVGEITREGEKYISVKPDNFKRAIRLKGAIYERQFSVNTNEAAKRETAERSGSDQQSSNSIVNELVEKMSIDRSKRAEYNQKRYRRSDRASELVTKSNEEDIVEGMDLSGHNSFHDLDRINVDTLLPSQQGDRSEKTEGNIDQPDQEQQYQDQQMRNRRILDLRNDDEWLASAALTLINSGDKYESDNFNRARAATHQSIRDAQQIDHDIERTSEAARSGGIKTSQSLESASSGVEGAIQAMSRHNDNSELDRFKSNINLVEYANSQGFEVENESSSKNSVVMSLGFDKIVIKTEANGHGVYFNVHNENDSGSIIDFVQNRTGKNLGEVRKELRAFSKTEPVKIRASHRKPKPISHDRDKALKAYLRADNIIVSDYLSSREISQVDSRFSNVKTFSDDTILFPHFDDQGFSGYERKGAAHAGFSSGGVKSMYSTTNIDEAANIVVVESGIDALSHAQLLGTGNDVAYVSIAGSMSDQQQQYIAGRLNNLDAKIWIATDNDKSGDKIAKQLRKRLDHAERWKPDQKDWNDQLVFEVELEKEEVRARVAEAAVAKAEVEAQARAEKIVAEAEKEIDDFEAIASEESTDDGKMESLLSATEKKEYKAARSKSRSRDDELEM